MDTKKSMSLKDKIGWGIIGLTALGSIPIYPIAIQSVAYLSSPTMSIEQSIELIEQQKNKHNFEGEIELIIGDGFYELFTTKKEGVYQITIQKDALKKPLLKHEFCHIALGHLEDDYVESQANKVYDPLESKLTPSNFKGWSKKSYKMEPAAMFCQFGLYGKGE